jgi:hypothetical protein
VLPFERKLEEQRQRQVQLPLKLLSNIVISKLKISFSTGKKKKFIQPDKNYIFLQLQLNDAENLPSTPLDHLKEPTSSPRKPAAATGGAETVAGFNTVESVQAEVVSQIDEEQEEEEVEESAEESLRREITRKAQALMEIMQAGAGVEEAISRHSAEIDDTLMELLQRRMEAARHLEKQSEILQGMEMLHRRLKMELDKKKATISMRLLDSILNILDGGEEEESSGASGSNKGRSIEVEKAVRARLRSAFGAAPLEADVMFLATQLAVRGQSIADELLEERVDGNVFIKEVTALLEGAMGQQKQLVAALEQLDPQAPEKIKVQEAINERSIALGLVQEVLVLARSCMKPDL